jgi:hypothetical protein
MATENFKMYKSPAFITFQQNWFKEEVADCVIELIKVGDRRLCCRTDSTKR